MVSSRLNMAYNLGNEGVINSLDSFKQQIIGEIAARSNTKRNKNVQQSDVITFGYIEQPVTEKKVEKTASAVKQTISVTFSKKPTKD